MPSHWITEEPGPGLGIGDYFVCITFNFFLLWLPFCQVRLGSFSILSACPAVWTASFGSG